MYYKSIFYFIKIGKCYQCQGNEINCGNEIQNHSNNTSIMSIVKCGMGDCWASRTEYDGQSIFERGCSNKTCSRDYKAEICKTIEGKKVCEKCCTGEKCNTWFLDGKAGADSLYYHKQYIILYFLVLLF